MTAFKKTLLALPVLLCALPALADEMKPGTVTILSQDGKVSSIPMPDQAKVADMVAHGQEVKNDKVFFVWGSKFYYTSNEKMADGRMSFDYWGFHGTR